ncbi:MAG: alanine racemase [Pseudomonadota bacterium]
MSRLAIATLSTENLLHNLEVIKSYAKNSDIMCMVKANAYGHGLRSVSMRLDGKVFSLGVASVDEALALRKVNVKAPITLMSGAFEADDLFIASCQNFHLIFHEETQINWLNNIKLPKPIKVWLKIDTGMGRLGFDIESAKKAYEILSKNSQVIQPIGIISHFACADDLESDLNKQQIVKFIEFTKDLPGPKTFANSAAIFGLPDTHYDMVRPGIAIYGISPFKDKTASELGLKPVMTLQTRLVSVTNAKKGSYIGYGSRFLCPEDMKIGVIAMGYGDGYPRTARDGTPILVNNKPCQLVGRVSMDMAMIDLRNCHDAKVGDPVILWGDGLPIEKIAKHTDNIPYDIICGVQQRVKFYWTV